MPLNVGSTDKLLRIVVGVVLLALVFILDAPARWWGLVGLVPLLTGLFNFCPLYAMLGISTASIDKSLPR
jgi:sulfite exporter TauE/SafE